jgi:hypothetical protein
MAQASLARSGRWLHSQTCLSIYQVGSLQFGESANRYVCRPRTTSDEFASADEVYCCFPFFRLSTWLWMRKMTTAAKKPIVSLQPRTPGRSALSKNTDVVREFYGIPVQPHGRLSPVRKHSHQCSGRFFLDKWGRRVTSSVRALRTCEDVVSDTHGPGPSYFLTTAPWDSSACSPSLK